MEEIKIRTKGRWVPGELLRPVKDTRGVGKQTSCSPIAFPLGVLIGE